MFITEIWKDIKGYEGLYQVSNLGRVKSFKFNKERLLKLRFTGRYYQAILTKNSKQKSYLIHRLVATYFIPNPENLPQVNHKDEDKANNSVDNLEWCNAKYNIHYGTGLQRRIATQCKPVLCVETGMNYPSAVEAGKQIGICHRHIGACCKGKRKTTGGYHWKYIEQGGGYHLYV